MTLSVLMILGGAAFGIFFLWYTRMKVDAWWYGTVTGGMLVYCMPPFGFATAMGGLFQLFQETGVEPSRILFGVPLFVVIIWMLGSFFSVMLGIPKPPFLTPRWMRERRREERYREKSAAIGMWHRRVEEAVLCNDGG